MLLKVHSEYLLSYLPYISFLLYMILWCKTIIIMVSKSGLKNVDPDQLASDEAS